jgi:hypothetical protein
VALLRIPHCRDNRLTDGGKVVSLTPCHALRPRNISYPLTSFSLLRLNLSVVGTRPQTIFRGLLILSSWKATALFRASVRQVKVKVKVTLRLTVSQSVCLGVEPKYGTFDQRFFFFKVTVLSFFGAPSLTRGWVCHVSVFVIEVYSSLSFLQNIYIYITP